MGKILRKYYQNLDAWLFRRGFAAREVRALVAIQLVVAGVSSAAGLAVSLFGALGLSFTAGAALVTLNFWSLAKFGQDLAHKASRKAIVSQLLRFYARLTLTAAALYVLLIMAEAPAAPLLAGVSTVVASVVFFGLSRLPRTLVKEA